MKYSIEIDCGAAAFVDDGDRELARILMVLAAQLPAINFGRREPIKLRDIDGHTVGHARFIHNDERDKEYTP